MDPVERPIGYWLRHLHNLIEARFTATLGGHGLGRRHWQILHLLSEGSRDRTALAAALAPFGPDDGALENLAGRGWVAESTPGQLTLTEPGRAAHAELAARVGETRQLLARGITRERYADTVRTLAAMAANLEADPDPARADAPRRT